MQDRASLLKRGAQPATGQRTRKPRSRALGTGAEGRHPRTGNWGELVLERVLEDSGLRRDHEYFPQASFRNDEGDLKRPGVVIRLPGSKDVVIDAKVSLAAYEAALAADDDERREAAVTRHVLSLRNHVRSLSAQSYERLKGVRSSTSCCCSCRWKRRSRWPSNATRRLFTEAFEKRLVIVSRRR